MGTKFFRKKKTSSTFSQNFSSFFLFREIASVIVKSEKETLFFSLSILFNCVFFLLPDVVKVGQNSKLL